MLLLLTSSMLFLEINREKKEESLTAIGKPEINATVEIFIEKDKTIQDF